MNLFDKWFLSKCKKAWNSQSVKEPLIQTIGTGPQRFEQQGMGFRIYRAAGGFVVESSSYDEHTDRNKSSLHVITDDQDLGQAIGQIVVIETLRN